MKFWSLSVASLSQTFSRAIMDHWNPRLIWTSPADHSWMNESRAKSQGPSQNAGEVLRGEHVLELGLRTKLSGRAHALSLLRPWVWCSSPEKKSRVLWSSKVYNLGGVQYSFLGGGDTNTVSVCIISSVLSTKTPSAILSVQHHKLLSKSWHTASSQNTWL